MNFEPFFEAIGKYIKLTNKEKSIIHNHLVYREIPKKFNLVEYGHVCKELYFVIEGCLRMYYLKDDGEEVTGFFFTENHFLSSFDSFLSATQSVQCIESLEECKLVVLSKDSLEKLYYEMPSMNVFARKLLEERFVNAQRVVASHIMHTPEERYTLMLKNNPQILNRVPQNTLASYLGITPVSLSRIRRRILG